jgi:hypothetical protein
MHASVFTRLAVLAGTVGLIACSDSSGPGPGSARLGLMVSTTGTGATAAGFAPESVTVGQHRLVLTKVELVMREIELKRVAGSSNCSQENADDAPAAQGDGGSKRRDDDDCLEVEIGPLVVDLPLGGGVKRIVSATVDTGTYREVEFKIHRLGSRSDDQAFLTAHPGLAGLSIRAAGTYDGKPFQFTTGVSAKQETDLSPPLVVAAQGATDLTLQVEVASWFVVGGVGLVDPATAVDGGLNENVVRQNIRRSFKVFEDHDHDGHRDR